MKFILVIASMMMRLFLLTSGHTFISVKCSVVNIVLSLIRILFRNKHDWSSLSPLSSSLWTSCCCCSRWFFSFFFVSWITSLSRVTTEAQMRFWHRALQARKLTKQMSKNCHSITRSEERQWCLISLETEKRKKKQRNERFIK